MVVELNASRDKVAGILSILKKEYPNARIKLRFNNPFQLLIATILSAQCTDDQVNKVTEVLFKKYSTPAELAAADITELEGIIHSTGFYKNKARNIKKAAQLIADKFNGEVPKRMSDLLELPGVARKTANIVLTDGYGIIEGIAVDTHVRRLSKRLGLSESEDPEKIELDLMELIPRADWGVIAHLLQAHGRSVCTAKNPNCNGCSLNKLCPSAFKF
ncbi:MAG: endonuclease III [Candidatus Odinarchaeum yellowstonii]|uniref:Endonuclease III n=1 Tax=Odinarchaeota yellowstonii (strain LCB_4) TaxID=1841599 RepID=A0AAF0IDA1_ODILC|nr:MAG: endonuclease III [Candidatus Odinarchaeum yellowstonii]